MRITQKYLAKIAFLYYYIHIYFIYERQDMKLGVVGLPNVGKSTLFNAITKAGAESANYPFCTIEPNYGVVDVPDERLDWLAKLYNTQKVTPAQIEFVDIAGLVKGASHGEGLGNKFLSHIREVDAIVHVVRCFTDGNIIHVEGSVDPIRDIDTVNTELILADMETVQKRLERVEKSVRAGDKQAAEEKMLLQRIYNSLCDETPARVLDFTDEEKKIVDGFFLLTDKPVLYVANIGESDLGKPDNELVERVKTYARQEKSEVITLCAKIEEELLSLDDDDRQMFKEELGITVSGLDQLVRASYHLLGLISFLTAGEKEVRAWTITNGTLAPQAAGKIHSDFEKGFIRADVVKYDDIVEAGDYNKAREKGKIMSVGKDYVFCDGDIALFKFNV